MSVPYTIFAVLWMGLAIAQFSVSRKWSAAPDDHARKQATAAGVMAAFYMCASLAFVALLVAEARS